MKTKEKLVPELRFPEFTDEWEEKKLGEVAEYSNYGMNTSAKKYDGINKYLRITDIDEITRNYIEDGLVSPSGILEDKYLLSEGDLLFARTGASVGKTYYYKKKDGKVYFAGYLIRFKIKKDYDYRFIFYTTLTEKYDEWVKVVSIRSGQPGINASEYSGMKMKIPSLPEQKKIGNFFNKIDKKLELQRKRIEELKTYKKGMMQRIFNQEIRFKDEKGNEYPEWEEKRIDEIFKESTLKFKEVENKELYEELLSVTLNKGIKKQSDLELFDTSNTDKSNYKIVNKKDIVYNSMRMWQGASGVSKYNGIVSSAYVILRPLEDIYSDFMAIYFKQPKSIYKFFKNSQGMTSDTLTLRYRLIKDIVFNIPSLPEQEKIANFLLAIDKKIELEEEKLKEYEEYKKGLMQRMFI